MKLLHIPTLLSAAILAIDGYAANANTVPTASDLQERTLNEQNNEANGIMVSVLCPLLPQPLFVQPKTLVMMRPGSIRL